MNIEININPTDAINTPSGDLKDQIFGSDLIANPSKYIHLYSSFYKNADEIKHSLGIKVRSAEKRMGSKSGLKQVGSSSGKIYNVLMSKKQYSAKKKK